MYKKALLSTMVASALMLSTGCEVSSVEDNDKVDTSPVSQETRPELIPFEFGTHPLFKFREDPRQLPLANDLLFASAAKTDGTAALETDTPSPVTIALNDLDGYSLTAPIDIPFSGNLLPESVNESTVFLAELTNSNEIDALNIEDIINKSTTGPFSKTPLRPMQDYSVTYIDRDDTPVVRVNLKTPLKPATKYLVIITNLIKDTMGESIVPPLDVQFFNKVTAPADPNSDLATPQKLVQGWTRLAAGYLSNASEGKLGVTNVASAYSFTTGGAGSILKAMAAPALHLQSPQLVGAATQAGALNAPQSRDFQIIQSAPGTPLSLTPANILGTTDTITRYVQGGLTIPVGISAPVLTDIAALAGGDTSAISKSLASDSIWRANTALGSVIDGETGKPAGTTPPKDSDGTTNVTYRYPHAALNETQTVPVLVTLPGNYSSAGGADCTAEAAKPWKVAIFTHGITSDRTASVIVGSQLAKACIATVAMDLPMHGVAPIRGGVNRLRVFNAEQNLEGYPFGQAANASGISIKERHYNVGTTPQTSVARVPMDFDGSEAAELSGSSGSHFINLFNFQRTRDNMRQAVVDLLNLSASIGNMDVTGDGAADLDADDINFIGHSLGAIVGIPFVAVSNDPAVQSANSNIPKIQTAILGNPGSQMTKLLENSPSFGPSIVGALAQAGIPQGSSSFESFFQAFQATIASADPVNFAQQLAKTGTPILLYNMVGGGLIGDDTTTLSDALKFAFGGKYPPDIVVPNYDYFKDESNPFRLVAPAINLPAAQATAKSSLAGTNPLIKLMELTEINASTASQSGEEPIQAAVLLQKGTHSTFAGAESLSTFAEIAKQMISFISSDGKTLPVDNSNDIYAPAANQ